MIKKEELITYLTEILSSEDCKGVEMTDEEYRQLEDDVLSLELTEDIFSEVEKIIENYILNDLGYKFNLHNYEEGLGSLYFK